MTEIPFKSLFSSISAIKEIGNLWRAASALPSHLRCLFAVIGTPTCWDLHNLAMGCNEDLRGRALTLYQSLV